MVTASPLTVLEPVANHDGGNIALAAEGMVATDDLTVQADILADGGSGWIELYAGDSLRIFRALTIGTAGTGAIGLFAATDYHAGTPRDGSPDGGLVVGGGATVSAAGKLTVLAEDDIDLQAASTLRSPQPIFIQSDVTDADSGVGATLTIAGKLLAPVTQIYAGNDDDVISYVITGNAEFAGMVAVHGGGGADQITVTGGGADSPMVAVYGDTSQDGLDYGPAPVASTLVAFTNPGADVLDASGATSGVVLFGGWGNDTLRGGAGDDFLAGGSGDDFLYGNGGRDFIFGDSGFNVDVASRTLVVRDEPQPGDRRRSADGRGGHALRRRRRRHPARRHGRNRLPEHERRCRAAVGGQSDGAGNRRSGHDPRRRG